MDQATRYQMQLLQEMQKAGILTAKSALTAADVSAYGGLKKEEATKFIDLVVDESELLKNIRVHRTDAPSGDIAKMTVSGHITTGVDEATASSDTNKPTPSVVSFVTKKTVSQIDISGEFTEDNIEGQGGRNSVLSMMTKQIGNDMETLGMEGDTANAGSTAFDKLVKVNDGIIKLTASGTGAHLIDVGGRKASTLLLSRMLRLMPTKYRKNKADLRWIMSANTMVDLVEELSGASSLAFTALADTTRTGGELPALFGIRPLVVPLMPEDLAIDGVVGDTGTVLILANPQNFIYVVQRDLTIEWDRVARGDKWEATIHMRTDMCVENTDAVVRTTDLNCDPDVLGYGASSAS